jgi:hypothetical protein
MICRTWRVSVFHARLASTKKISLEAHGFADASNHAYAAVMYLRVIHSLTNFQVSLICAKTKVARQNY